MAKRKDVTKDRLKKRDLWVNRTVRWSGRDRASVEKLLLTQRTQSFRANPLRPRNISQAFLKNPVKWCENGYELENAAETLSSDNLTSEGIVYIQNAASWLPVLALEPQPGEVILDVCAAPGGKASHIQAITNNQSKLTCNDNSKPRLLKLQANMRRLGAEASYTLCDATRLSRTFQPETFDKILLDAPCSGEGLMSLLPQDEKHFDSWSVAHIRRLSDLQKKIVSESWNLLKPGGVLVYSTCTMAPEENESVIDYFLRKHPEAKLETVSFPLENTTQALQGWNNKVFENDLSSCLRLVPGKLTEAFFVAKLKKDSLDSTV